VVRRDGTLRRRALEYAPRSMEVPLPLVERIASTHLAVLRLAAQFVVPESRRLRANFDVHDPSAYAFAAEIGTVIGGAIGWFTRWNPIGFGAAGMVAASVAARVYSRRRAEHSTAEAGDSL
jgi:hypothetical protein